MNTEKYTERLCGKHHHSIGSKIPAMREEIADEATKKALKFVKEGKKFRGGY